MYSTFPPPITAFLLLTKTVTADGGLSVCVSVLINSFPPEAQSINEAQLMLKRE